MTGAARIRFDPRADALYIHLRSNESTWQQEYSENVILDFDPLGQIVGIEVLHPGSVDLGKLVAELSLDPHLAEILSKFQQLMQEAEQELVLA